jgi:hypothetical protein
MCLHGFDQSGQLHQNESAPSVGYSASPFFENSSSTDKGISPAYILPTVIAPRAAAAFSEIAPPGRKAIFTV